MQYRQRQGAQPNVARVTFQASAARAEQRPYLPRLVRWFVLVFVALAFALMLIERAASAS